ncbi:hypothetical protein M231_03510 [Tremella mesenterica]|uniref:Short-chain dehydrogenase n=1 Tax=Tremella mesenterica TaxID=5217 RepID=A0A4Q1BMT8_TREME|nr:hypothetical protein M231_03510 [Tremella mesenterica]
MVTALVTGANRGLGLGFIRQLLLRPQVKTIIGTSRSLPPDDILASLVGSNKGRIRRVILEDISDISSCANLAEQIKDISPNGVNLLINNAGYAHQPDRRPGVRETGLSFPSVAGAKDYETTWRINAFGPLLLTATLLDHGLLTLTRITTNYSTVNSEEEVAIAEVPVVVNISSRQASVGMAAEMFTGDGDPRDDLYFHHIYAASKVALSGVTLHLARTLRDRAIVGAIHPGFIKTEMGRLGADLTTDQSASHVLDVAFSWKTLKDSGQYVDYLGRRLPW